MKTNLLIGNRKDCGFDCNSSRLAETLPLIRHRGLDHLRKTARQLASSVMLAAAVFAAPLEAQIVFDATADFSITNGNPNGAWSYGWMPTDFSLFNRFVNNQSLPHWGPLLYGWYGWSDDAAPHILLDQGSGIHPYVPPGWLTLHPGTLEEPAALRWTSPFPGSARIQGRFLAGDQGAMLIHVRMGGQAVWQALDSGEFDLLESVMPGDTLDFVVYGGYWCGNTPLQAVISLTPAGGVIAMRRSPISVAENANVVSVEVLRCGPEHLDHEVAVDYATIDGTAHAGQDYVAASGTLRFAAGETNKLIAITILDDTLPEPWEEFRLVLNNPTGGVSLGNSNVVIRIRSDELPTYYVNVANPNPVFPHTSWATAARSIQDAVAAGTEPGRVVLVTNGIYRAGIFEAEGPNRVALTNQVVLRSLNGPEATIIDGGGSVRCVYLAADAVISGFTLTNGTAGSGGGACGGTVTNCTLAGNSADCDGGGACNSILHNCTLAGNTVGVWDGGGGGGASSSSLYNCILTDNSDAGGGGGGGVLSSTLHNCSLTGNSGAGADSSTLYNCTLSANTSVGANECSLYNCIVYNNRAPSGGNYSGGKFEYSCTTPLPPGPGNIDLDPQLTADGHLWPTSPCLGAGSANYASGLDIDGEPWSNPPPMGADQLIPGSVTGPLTVRIEVPHTRFAAGYAIPFVAQNTGRILASVWDFGDGTLVTNQVFVSHAWTAPGVYTVRLTGYNDSFPAGVASTVQVEVIDAVHYVNMASPNPVFPYTSWATAATNIQDAVVAGTVVGRLLLVTNGVYRAGSVETNGLNRVALTNAVVLRSVNGPSVTLIEGAPGPTDYPEESIRCIYVGDGALVSGFTLTNGWAYAKGEAQATGGGGVYGAPFGVLTNCTLTGNSVIGDYWYIAGNGGGGASGGTLYNCTLTGNWASAGGGADSSRLYDCTLTGNSAGYYGGGAYGSTLYNCTLTGNSASSSGGGARSSTLYDCTLADNSASSGGGVYGGTLYNCIVMGNTAGQGGGVYAGYGGYKDRTTFPAVLYNCTLVGNTAQEGGGAYGAPVELYNCIVAGNTAGQGGGTAGGKLYNCVVTKNAADEAGGVTGAYGPWSWGSEGSYRVYYPSQLRNCIVYLNHALSGANYGDASFEYSCTMPLPEGAGNIDVDPQLAWDNHLLPTSPCVAAGNATYATGRDMDGELWANPPCMGADQFVPGPVTGALTMQIHSDSSQVAPGYVVLFVAQNTGRLVGLVWDFGGGTLVTNRAFVSHAWTAPGLYTVRLTGYNDTFPAGVPTTAQVEVIDTVHYVNVANLNPLFPFTSWQTAATNIQDAVTASIVPGHLVLVTNGVYRTGVATAKGTNRVALTNVVVLRSVNGPDVTTIEGASGDQPVRCGYVGNRAVLSGFTLSHGKAEVGGGVYGQPFGVVTNCTLTGNSASWYGGGACGSTLNNCTLTGNSAGCYGGGACGSAPYTSELNNCTLNNCTLSGNSAGFSGGGACGSTLYNCLVTDNGGGTDGLFFNCTVVGNNGGVSGTLFNSIVYGNTNGNYTEGTILNYCLTTPLPTNGMDNITNAPLFVSYASGNLRLQSNSPCINAGLNAYSPSATDFDGNPRIVSGSVDIGAYEYQGSGSTISYAWLQHYGLPTDGSADATDPDADGHNTWQEWRCQTDPTNALSVLRLLTASPAGTNLTVSWQSVAGVNYFLERSTDLSASPPFTLLAPNLPGQPSTTSYVDTNAVGAGPFFYRVGVGN